MPFHQAQKPPRGSAAQPDHIMLSFSGDAHTQMSVTWRTDTTVEAGYLLYREAGTAGDFLRADARSEILQSDIDISRFYWAAAQKLTPGTRYEYTVGCENHRSELFHLETEPEDLQKFRFIVISDHQKGQPHALPDYSIVRRLLQNALRDYPDCRFILTVGDNCDNGQNETQWNGMFEGLRGIIESVPYMMCTGNHDNRGFLQYLPEPVGKFYLEHADYFDAQFAHSYPRNGPEGYETENYSFDCGNAHFLVMGINAPQTWADWAYDDLQKSEKTWKLGCYHFPIYPLMPEGQNDDGYPWLRKPVGQGRLDILFAGHEHSFARTFPIQNDELFDRPSEGTVHFIMGNSSANIYISNAQKVWHSCFYPQEEPVAMVSIVEIDGEVLRAHTYLDDGRVVDDFTLDKANDRILPPALAPRYKRTKMAYKGDMLELIARGHGPMQVNGVWYAPFALVIQYIGGAVEKRSGSVRVSVYDRHATFTEGERDVQTDRGIITMSAEVLRENGQLYMPVADSAAIFGMQWYYAEQNNFINWNHESENRTLSEN